MYMRTAGFVKHTGKEDFIGTERRSTDRTHAFFGPAPLQAVDTPFYMHKPAPAIPRIRENRGFDEFPMLQEDAADRATPGRTGAAFPEGVVLMPVKEIAGRMVPIFTVSFLPSARLTGTEK
jgi:hypothetical protein